ncbi:MAG: PAS domain-containing protein [Rhodobacterales bacterium]|nr:PAS domain-containing protein [Rhodobacterales bacterium]
MSFIEKRIENRPATGEAPFRLAETFYSRTDKRGIILAGNEVFRRVSAYSWGELINAPHKTIRHPDMPKGVFWLFWDTLNKGEPIGAYVMNQAKDGLYYWVFAIALPTSDGYISLRIKPSSPVFAQISEIYADLRAKEGPDGNSPEQSSQALIEVLKGQGFPDYSSFATHALAEELLFMDRAIERARDRSVTTFKSIVAAVTELQGFMATLADQFEAIGSIPTNMRLHASRLEPAGGSLTALSENYWKMANDMTTWFNGFTSSSGNAFASIEEAINNAMLNKCAERLIEKTHSDLEADRKLIE